jgi:hypothetical protein
MSDLDSQASMTIANMIRYGSAVSMLPPGIATVAAFTFKTAVVVDCITTDRPRPFFSHADRKRFAATLEIPRGVQVWLSTFHGPRVHGRFTCHYGQIRGGRFKKFEFYVFTYVAGFLVLQLTAFRWNSVAKRPSFNPRFIQDTLWDVVSIPLWPPDGKPVTWPSSQYLTRDSVKVLADRWGRISEVVS